MQYVKMLGVFLLCCLSAIAVAQSKDGDADRAQQDQPAVETQARLSNSVAVLPFENRSPRPEDAYFASGIHEAILFQLTKIRDINPIARPSVLRNAGGGETMAEIAAMFNVETALKGRVRYADNRVNMTVQHIDTATHTPLWSETYDRELSDIFAIQAEIVERIVRALGADLSSAEQARIDKVPTRSLEAYMAYMKARALIRATLAANMPPQFYQYLDEAITLDPDFALAHAVKASAYGLSHLYGVPRGQLTFNEIKRVARVHADRALALDPNLGMAYMAQAFVHFSNLHGTAAKQAFERALQLGPNDVEILDGYRRFLSVIEDHDEAIRLAKRDVELTPNVGNPLMRLGQTSMFAGKPGPAIDNLHKSVELFPQFHAVHRFYAMALITAGNIPEALTELQLAEKLLNDRNPARDIARTAYGYSILGLREDAMRVFGLLQEREAKGEFISIRAWIEAYLAIGEIEKAYAIWAQNPVPSEGMRILQFIKSNIVNNPILEEPRFVKLRNQLIAFID